MSGKKNIMKTVKKMAEFIKKEHGAKDVILFGSYAYGNPGPDSDIDLMIVSESEERTIKQAADIYSSLSGSFPAEFPVDIVVRNKKYLKKFPEDMLTKKAMSQGIKL